MECLVLHEHHVAYFKAAHEVLDRGTEVATAGPDILNKGDVFRVDSKSLCQPAVVELNALFLEELVVVRLVEHLDAKHDEARIVAARQTDVVQVVEAGAELRADERVGGRVKLTRHAVGLEAENTSGDVVDIVSPPSNNRVPFDGVARNARTCQT